MPDLEARDAYVAVTLELPNGKTIQGRPIPWRTGMRLQAALNVFAMSGEQKDFDALWSDFVTATGITEEQLATLDPQLSLLELLDLIRRFTYLLRPGRTAVQVPAATPPTPAASASPSA